MTDEEQGVLSFDRPDPVIYSNTRVGGEWLTWRELAERQDQELRHAEQLIGILADLDRCKHGRHEGDVCSECKDGVSAGNFHESHFLGWGIGGRKDLIIMPKRGERHDPNAWRQRTEN